MDWQQRHHCKAKAGPLTLIKMAIVQVDQGGQKWWCVTPSESPTWRMTWDGEGIVQDLFEGTEETLNLAVLPLDPENPNIFEGETRDECMAKVDEDDLYFDPAVET